jgi:hypothetical protein
MTNTNRKLISLSPLLNGEGLKTKRDDDPPYQEYAYMIVLCEQWIKAYCKPRVTINNRAYSYVLKHVVERWADNYVTNAAFIQAAINLGYTYKNAARPGYRLTPNAMFNMSLPRKRTQLRKDAGFHE